MEDAANLGEIMKQLGELRRELEREKAVTAIQNRMAHYCIVHNQRNMDRHPSDFALTMPDVEFRGCVGEQALRRQFCEDWYVSEEDAKGILLIHYLTNPCIQVAGDCKTARGVWWSPGIECKPDPDIEGEKSFMASWAFMMYAADFIVENGEWKIWHLTILPVIKCKYEDGPVKGFKYYFEKKVRPDDPWYKNPYHTGYTQKSVPAYPQPYETWDGDKYWFTKEENN